MGLNSQTTSSSAYVDPIFISSSTDYYHRQPSDTTSRELEAYYLTSPTDGWLPSIYPNPKISPSECRISQLMDRHGYHPSRSMQDEKLDAPSVANSSDTLTMTDPNDEHASEQQTSLQKLLLCDPDNILSQDSMDRVSAALYNFTLYYGHGPRLSKNPALSQEQDEKRGISVHPNELPDAELSVGRTFLRRNDDSKESNRREALPMLEIGVAVAEKINVRAILEGYFMYDFEDEEDEVSDAAQYFAMYLHSQWWKHKSHPEMERDVISVTRDRMINGILIFLSVDDKVCFISSGSGVGSILPWWRLEDVVNGMQHSLSMGRYGEAIISGIHRISSMVDSGKPTFREKADDFVHRFGFVLIFSCVSLVLGICGEHRDKKNRMEYAEELSQLTDKERENARILQRGFKTDSCPICLETYDTGESDNTCDGSNTKLKKVDSYGIPLYGSDGLPLKLLRCGHTIDQSCWKHWVDASERNGNGYLCPCCRQDIGSGTGESARLSDPGQQVSYGTSDTVT